MAFRLCSICGTSLESSQTSVCANCLPGSKVTIDSGDTSPEALSSAGSTANTSDPPVLRFDHFVVELDCEKKPLLLGRGAMGLTYRAFDTVLRRSVALKVIASHLIGNEALQNRFLKEARATASLRHPNIASVFYLGSTENSYFYAMELVGGQTLEHLIAAEGPLSIQQSLEITAQVCSALGAAHHLGLIHRDIKPSNLIVSSTTEGQLGTKVIDFGLAKLNSEPSDDSDPGVFFGTPRYASPEQFSGEPVDIRSDIYSLGITLWQMVTNTLPFEGSPSEIAAQHLRSRLPMERLRHCPQYLVALLRKMLARHPGDRPQTPEALQRLIQETQRNLQPANKDRRVQPFGSGWLWKRQFRPWQLAAGAALLLLAGGSGLYLSSRPTPFNDSEKSVAVLPFDNIGGDSQADYLSDGLTTEIIFQLSTVADLRVIARSSIGRYKVSSTSSRKTIREIGSELNVGTVLESSIQRVGNRLKIVTILYDAREDRRLWGASYDRQIDDVFAVESDLAKHIVASLSSRLTTEEHNTLERRPTGSSAAYQRYLEGQALYHLSHNDDNERAIELFRQAIEIDPTFALAYAAMANAHIDRYALFEQDESNLDLASDFARRAIVLDSNQARGYTALARALNYKDQDEEAEEYNTKALRLAPNDFEANKRAAYLADAAGQFGREYQFLKKCHAINPLDPYAPFFLSLLCVMADETKRGDGWLRMAIELETDSVRKTILRSNRAMLQGTISEAETSLRSLPLGLRAYGNTVLELLTACAARLGHWNTVLELTEKRLKEGAGSWSWDQWSLVYRGLYARSSNDQHAVRNAAEQIASIVRSENQDSQIHDWEAFNLAIAERLLGHDQEAYKYLGPVFNEKVLHLPLMFNDPTLDAFRNDQSFNEVVAAANKTKSKLREDIAELEKD
jgi:eukaryotic-like serine/threonine-protein kinase